MTEIEATHWVREGASVKRIIWLDRPDLEILDFEMSKIWENIAKKYFLEKNQKILGKLLCVNTSFLT